MFFTSDHEINALAGSFYARTMPLSRWTKATQLAVTLYFAIRFPYRMALDLLSERIQSMWAGNLTFEDRSQLQISVQLWLETARSFSRTYQNIEDLSSLANIFIATHWNADTPFPRYFDSSMLDADTARLELCHDDFEDTIEISFQPSPSPALA